MHLWIPLSMLRQVYIFMGASFMSIGYYPASNMAPQLEAGMQFAVGELPCELPPWSMTIDSSSQSLGCMWEHSVVFLSQMKQILAKELRMQKQLAIWSILDSLGPLVLYIIHSPIEACKGSARPFSVRFLSLLH